MSRSIAATLAVRLGQVRRWLMPGGGLAGLRGRKTIERERKKKEFAQLSRKWRYAVVLTIPHGTNLRRVFVVALAPVEVVMVLDESGRCVGAHLLPPLNNNRNRGYPESESDSQGRGPDFFGSDPGFTSFMVPCHEVKPTFVIFRVENSNRFLFGWGSSYFVYFEFE